MWSTATQTLWFTRTRSILRPGRAALEVSTAGHTEEEQRTVHDIRWWPAQDLTEGVEIWPRGPPLGARPRRGSAVLGRRPG